MFLQSQLLCLCTYKSFIQLQSNFELTIQRLAFIGILVVLLNNVNSSIMIKTLIFGKN